MRQFKWRFVLGVFLLVLTGITLGKIVTVWAAAPTIVNAVPDQIATENNLFDLTFGINTFGDPDGDILSYSAQLAGGGALPAWLNFNANTRTFSGTPDNANIGTITVEVTANDGNTTVSDFFDLEVQSGGPTSTTYETSGSASSTQTLVAGSPLYQSFSHNSVAPTYGVESIVLQFAKDPAAAEQTITVSLLSGSYNGTVLASNTLPSADTVTSIDWREFTFASELLDDSQLYFIKVETDGVDGLVGVGIHNTNVYPRGSLYSAIGAADSNRDLAFQVVGGSNNKPVQANPIPNQNATEDAALNFQFANNVFDDLDGDSLVYEAELAEGSALPAWLSFDFITRTFSGTPTNSDVGTISISVIADDGLGGTAADTFDIITANSNDAPTVANVIPNQNATEDAAFNFQFASNTFNDIDGGDSLSYSAQLAGGGAMPAWLEFNAASRTFNGTPNNAHVGIVSIDVIASDGNGGTVTDTFNIVVANTNDAPTVANSIPNQNATEDVAFNFTFASNTFNDVDAGNTLTYTAQLAGGGAVPSWLSFNGGTRTFSGTPLNANVGTISIDVIASDGNGGSVTDTFNIVVANTNDLPTVANPIANQNATEDAAFNFQFASNTFNDLDVGNSLTYSSQLAGGGALPAWLSFDSVTRTFSGTPLNSNVGTLSVEVIADDGNGGSVTDNFDIEIANVNDAPTVVITPSDYYTDEQVAINLHGTNIVVADDDGDQLAITITGAGSNSNLMATVGATGAVLISGQNTNTLIILGTVAQINNLFAGNNGATLTYRLSGDTPPATRLLTISASDGSLSGSDTAIININAVNDAPVNTVPGAQATDEDIASVFNAGNGSQIQVADLDSGTGDLEITLSVTNGNLTLAGVGGLVFTTGDGTSDSSMVFRGTVAAVNTALATLTFNPTANFNGTSVLSITTSDLGNTGTGGVLSDTDNINIIVNAVNDAPTIANAIPNQNATENVVFNFQFALNTFADVDPGDDVTYTAQLAGGGAFPAWLSFDSLTRTFSGTPLNANVGTVSIEVIADDSNGGTIIDTFNIIVAAYVDPPVTLPPITNTPANNSTNGEQNTVGSSQLSSTGDSIPFLVALATLLLTPAILGLVKLKYKTNI